MHILIVGGTGFIGARVRHALGAHEVTVFHRGTGCVPPAGDRHLHGDRADLGSFRPLLREHRPDVVVDMGAQNAGDARTLIDAIDGLAGRIVVVSSASVYRSFGVLMGVEAGPVDNTPAREDAPLRRQMFPYRGALPRPASDPRRWLDDYDKVLAERAFAERSLPCSIVRLPMVYGPGDPDRRLAGYLRRMRDRRPVILLQESIAAWHNSRAYVENVAAAIARVAVAGAAGRAYNVADLDDLSEADWIRRISEQVGWRGVVRTVPDGSPVGRLGFDEFPPDARFAQHLRLDDERIRGELHYREVVSFDDALRHTVAAIPEISAIDYAEEDRFLVSGL